MPDDQKPNDGNPPAGEPENKPPEGTPKPQEGDGDDKPMDAEAAKKLRSENKNLRDRLKESETKNSDFEKRLKAIEDKDLSDKEKAEKAAQEAASRNAVLQQRLIDSEIEKVATKLGFKTPGLAAKLIDQKSLKLDPEGSPTNATELLEQLLKDSPELKGGTLPTGDGGNPGGGAGKQGEEQKRAQALQDFPYLSQRVPAQK